MRRTIVQSLAAALVAHLAMLASAAGAQTVSLDSLPFRSGQWAIQLAVQESEGNAAFLRFTSPRSAWLVAPGLVFSQGSATISSGFGPDEEADTDVFGVNVRLGRRGYRPLGRSVASFLGSGLKGEFVRITFASFGEEQTQRRAAAGVYGELGATYFFTPRFGLGGSATADILYRNTTRGSGETGMEATEWVLALPETRLLVTIVF